MIFNNQSASTRRALSTSAISPRRYRARKADSTNTRAPLPRGKIINSMPVDYRRCHERVPQVLVRRGRGHEISRDVGAYYDPGKKLKAKGGAVRSAQAVSHSFGDRDVCLSAAVVVRRQGGGSRREDGGNQQQEHDRLRQVHDELLQDTCDEGGWRGTTPATTGVPVADHLVHAQWRVDLHSVAAQSGQVLTEKVDTLKPISCTRLLPKDHRGSSVCIRSSRTC